MTSGASQQIFVNGSNIARQLATESLPKIGDADVFNVCANLIRTVIRQTLAN